MYTVRGRRLQNLTRKFTTLSISNTKISRFTVGRVDNNSKLKGHGTTPLLTSVSGDWETP